MELTIKNLEKIWNNWVGSEDMLLKDLKRPVNFLGSEKTYKDKFLNFAKKVIEDEQ